MELKYLGTGGAEGIPALFCRCPVCDNAESAGGREVRTRSQSIVDNRLLIDFPADSYMHMLSNKLRLSDVRHLIITHSHCDHFYPQDLNRRWGSYAHGVTEPLQIYGNEMVEQFFADTCGNGFGVLSFNPLEPFETYDIGGYAVTPLLARHDKTERCYIYLINDRTKTLLYAHDTGVFPDETWDYLEKNRPLIHLASLDCGFLSVSNKGRGHMSIYEAAAVKDRLLSMGCADTTTLFAINHITHNGGWSHAETEPKAAAMGLITAYDGLSIIV